MGRSKLPGVSRCFRRKSNGRRGNSGASPSIMIIRTVFSRRNVRHRCFQQFEMCYWRSSTYNSKRGVMIFRTHISIRRVNCIFARDRSRIMMHRWERESQGGETKAEGFVYRVGRFTKNEPFLMAFLVKNEYPPAESEPLYREGIGSDGSTTARLGGRPSFRRPGQLANLWPID